MYVCMHTYVFVYTYMGGPQNNLFIKKCVFVFTCLNFGHLQSTLHLMQYSYGDVSSIAKNGFWTHWFWCLLVFCCFLFHPFHISKTFLFEDFFHLGKTKKVSQGKSRWVERVGFGGHAVFGQKLLNTQCSVGRCAHKSSIMKWANMLNLPKNSLKLNTASHNNASWYTDTDGFLEPSPSRGSLYYKGPALQKIIPLQGGSSFIYNFKKVK